MMHEESRDTQWDLVFEIAAKMWIEGQYVAHLNPLPTQRLVDLQWAAHQAGRVLGGRAKVHVNRPPDPQDRTVTVTVTYVDPTGRNLRRADEGLEELLRLVLEDQTGRWSPFPTRTAHSGPSSSGAQQMNGKSTTTTIAVQITEAETEANLSLDAEFHYDPADPLAVTMVIDPTAGPVRWTFARDLILNGQFVPTGDGDVHVWPCLDTEGAAVVIVELDSPSGATLLQVPARAVHEFVSASLATVPEGAERHDVDAWIEQLFADPDSATN